jgi:hypothetical protein
VDRPSAADQRRLPLVRRWTCRWQRCGVPPGAPVQNQMSGTGLHIMLCDGWKDQAQRCDSTSDGSPDKRNSSIITHSEGLGGSGTRGCPNGTFDLFLYQWLVSAHGYRYLSWVPRQRRPVRHHTLWWWDNIALRALLFTIARAPPN